MDCALTSLKITCNNGLKIEVENKSTIAALAAIKIWPLVFPSDLGSFGMAVVSKHIDYVIILTFNNFDLNVHYN